MNKITRYYHLMVAQGHTDHTARHFTINYVSQLLKTEKNRAEMIVNMAIP